MGKRMSSLTQHSEKLAAQRELMKDPIYARLDQAFGGKQLEVKALMEEVITRRKLVKAGELEKALARIPRQYGTRKYEENGRSEVASALVINAILDEIEREQNDLSEPDLLERAFEILMKRNLGWAVTDRLGYVSYNS